MEDDDDNAAAEGEDDNEERAVMRGFRGLKGFRWDGFDDSDSDWDDGEEVTSPVDDVDAFIMFAETMTMVSTADPTRWQALTGGLDQQGQVTMQLMAGHAAVRREEMAKEKASFWEIYFLEGFKKSPACSRFQQQNKQEV